LSVLVLNAIKPEILPSTALEYNRH